MLLVASKQRTRALEQRGHHSRRVPRLGKPRHGQFKLEGIVARFQQGRVALQCRVVRPWGQCYGLRGADRVHGVKLRDGSRRLAFRQQLRHHRRRERVPRGMGQVLASQLLERQNAGALHVGMGMPQTRQERVGHHVDT